MKNTDYLIKVINVVFLELGIFFLILPFLVLLASNESIKENFGIYDTTIIHKRIFGITDNSIIEYEQLLTPILSCKFPEPILNEIDSYDLEILLNKNIRLQYDYRPSDLIEISSLNIPSNGTVYLRKETAEALALMNNELKKKNINIRINSGWRNFISQEKAYEYWKSALGSNAQFYAAPVGGSEHHLGVAFDIVTSENNFKLLPSYTNTRLHNFLTDSAYIYGFVNSYPLGKENITGYTYEPWHYRYVGKEIALKLRSLDISLTEYLYKLNNYCLITY